ncbi:hypothetical protein WJU23_14075 [Prosthecobacter sp. SYSU 5D2]|uniref:hypothetical protein n=1 Tax=Prosthecobacter sp. SYSU 5D2 TaxID=3134134 RepID=UPI0031FE4D76
MPSSLLPLKTALLLAAAGLSWISQAAAQENPDQYRNFAPTKDVAMLVDVSVSVQRDTAGHEGARGIIQDLLEGKPLSNTNWVAEPGSPEMGELFADYLREPRTANSAELRPLMAAGNSFLSLPVGNLTTVLNGEVHRKLRDIQGIRTLVADGYPRQMKDTSTCYWFAMAQAADTLSQKSRLGYYLFVVSDEEDDPDYRADGPPGHTARDYDRYLKELAPQYPVESIRAAIGKYFLPARPSPRNAEVFTPRDSFKQVLIARFYQKGSEARSSARNQKVRISWYAMGVAPEKVLVPREPPPLAPGEPEPVKPLAYQPPKQTARLQFLGGLDSGKKRFDYAKPILVWQIANLEGSGWDAGSRPVVELVNSSARAGGLLNNSPRKVIKSWQVPDQLPNGTHPLEVEFKGGDASSALSQDLDIVKNASSTWWLNILAIVSGVVALVIFFIAWRSLKEKRVVSSPA